MLDADAHPIDLESRLIKLLLKTAQVYPFAGNPKQPVGRTRRVAQRPRTVALSLVPGKLRTTADIQSVLMPAARPGDKRRHRQLRKSTLRSVSHCAWFRRAVTTS